MVTDCLSCVLRETGWFRTFFSVSLATHMTLCDIY